MDSSAAGRLDRRIPLKRLGIEKELALVACWV